MVDFQGIFFENARGKMNKIKITILYNSYKFISKVLLETFFYITLFKNFSKKDKKEDKYEKFN